MDKTVIELFAGVGGFRVGLNDIHGFNENGRAIENRDWNFVWANQWEPSTTAQDAFNCYITRFGESEHHCNEDISKVKKETIPNHNLLVGGFPCQDYSVARSLSGEKGIEGKKGVLFWEIAEILSTKRTPFMLLENVDRLLKSPARQRGRDFGIMLRTLNDLGYNVQWRVINAADYGCAQRRRRVFIFAWRKELLYNRNFAVDNVENLIIHDGLFAQAFPIIDEDSKRKLCKVNLNEYSDTVDITENFHGNFNNAGVMIDGIAYSCKVLPKIEKPITLREIREDRINLQDYFLSDIHEVKFQYLKNSKKVPRKKPNGEDYLYSEGSMSFPDDLDLPGRTMLTSERSVNRSTHVILDAETGQLRYLTPVEAERLQSFPDNWTKTGMVERKRYFMMGNALVTKIINRLEPYLSAIFNAEE